MLNQNKKCVGCGKVKPLTEYYFRKDTNKYFGKCKRCHLSKGAEWANLNKEVRNANARKSRTLNPEKNRLYVRKYIERNTEKARESRRLAARKYRKSIIGKINSNFGTALCNYLQGKKGLVKWQKLVGYTPEELKRHLENKFNNGMSWENYGKWHIDHIIPKSFFVFGSVDDVEFKYCWSLDNLQPMWGIDNKIKHAKLNYKIAS